MPSSRPRRCRSGPRCEGARTNRLASSGWIEVMRNSATATSRTSPISRWSSAEKARASSVGSPGRSCALVTSSCAWLGAASSGGEQPAAAKPRIEQRPGDAGQARRSTSEGVGHVAQPRLELPCLALERKRVGARLDVLEERRHRVGNGELEDDRSSSPVHARLTRGVWRTMPRDDNGAERRQKARNQQPAAQQRAAPSAVQATGSSRNTGLRDAG